MFVEAMEDIEYSIHSPSPFIDCSWQALLPTWNTPVLSVLVSLQRSPVLLCEATPEAEATKQRLREQSLHLLMPIVQSLHRHQYPADIFDPRTGLPLCGDDDVSRMPLNDVAVVHSLLGYARHQYGQCHCIVHPIWGSSVYPTILLSAAPPGTCQQLAEEILAPLHCNPASRA